MTHPTRSTRTARRAGTAAVLVASAAALVLTQSVAHGRAAEPDQPTVHPPGDLAPDQAHLEDLDIRTAAAPVAPTAAQREAVAELRATARWSPSGTPQSLIRYDSALADDIDAPDPASAARSWLDRHHTLYRLDSTAGLETHAEVPLSDDGYVVVLRQTAGGLPVSPGGFASVGVSGSPEEGWSVVYASSTLAPEQPLARAATGLSMRDALVAAASDVGADIEVPRVSLQESRAGWRVFGVTGVNTEQLVRRVAYPHPDGTLRPAYETHYYDGQAAGYRHLIDASDGTVLLREDIVHELARPSGDEPTWDVYPAKPLMTAIGRPPWHYPDVDWRDTWCWTAQPRCRLAVQNDAAGLPWDVDPRTGEPTHTTVGNAVVAGEAWALGTPGQQPTSDIRRYQFPWTNVWHESGCHSDNFVPGGNDIDASVTNLFVANWRMHDWAYRLGFTEETWNGQLDNFGRVGAEEDPVVARAQAGAVSPGFRNNATMATRPDGVSSVMSMFLWQPQENSFYGPCAAGDVDMSVIGHEYTHMIENRLIGKGDGRSGFHAGAMGESWSDFISMEYQNEYGFRSGGGVNPWTVGAYVTGNPDRGIRNYNMSFPSAGQFPQPGRDVQVGTLHFGAMGYDFVGPQVHADSQIWSATNHDLRTLFLDRYPSNGAKHQRECADGQRSVEDCPGNRRWIQLAFDAMLLMPTAPTMLDARDAYFAADMLRFDRANEDLLWQGFARRGFGEHASVSGTQDVNPVSSFESPRHEEATLRFEAVAKDEGGTPVDAEIYVGNYEARVTPIGSVARFVPDPEGYQFVARADGYGHVRFRVDHLEPGEDRTITIHFPTNVASAAQGAAASGDGSRHGDLIDDTEATNWQSASDLPNVVTIDPPSGAAGQYGASGASFGPEPTQDGFAGDISLVDDGSADPTLGCQPLVGFPEGAIALIDRGQCAFTQKVSNAQAAGAGAVIVANNVPGDPFTMGGADASIDIPSVMVSLADGGTIRDGLPATGTVAVAASEPVAGTQVTVALDGTPEIRHAQVSAMLLPGQNRFTALRQFALYACTEGGPDNPTCDGTTDAGWDRFLRSGSDAFPAPNPRPSSPDVILRGFRMAPTDATHVKFVVLANQCTGNPNYQGDQHDDPLSPTADCRSTSVGSDEVRTAELQLLTSRPEVDGATVAR